jgi:hypothetical protein
LTWAVEPDLGGLGLDCQTRLELKGLVGSGLGGSVGADLIGCDVSGGPGAPMAPGPRLNYDRKPHGGREPLEPGLRPLL